MAKKQTDGNLALEQQRVIVIPAHDEIVARKLRVAAYARVSSSSEDQLNSYRVQNQYYSELISNNPDWEMVDIYADEGITGTSVEKREDFKRMMADCRKGKIDRILVKSISRFARNTKDCLVAVRELKELGVTMPLATKNTKPSACDGYSRRSSVQQNSMRSCCKVPSPPCW